MPVVVPERFFTAFSADASPGENNNFIHSCIIFSNTDRSLRPCQVFNPISSSEFCIRLFQSSPFFHSSKSGKHSSITPLLQPPFFVIFNKKGIPEGFPMMPVNYDLSQFSEGKGSYRRARVPRCAPDRLNRAVICTLYH